MPKYSPKDVEILAQYLQHAKDSGAPFAILMGAGCSITAGIPGAAALVEEINRDLAFCLGDLTADERKDYGKCMSCLPEHTQRKLLKNHLDKSKVNWGHLALAGMMKAGYIGRVLTFNFDSILARACGLVGIYPATYDFAAAPTDTFSHISDQAIFHLHGQGHGFFMFNSEEKTANHAERLLPLLKDIFDKHHILAIGYSGTSDAVFSRLTSIFTGRNALFWAGRTEDLPSHLGTLLVAGGRTATYLGGIDADRFLLELTMKLGCMPSLFEDPYGHLLDELADVTVYPLTDDATKDVLEELRQELKAAQEQKRTKGPSIADLFRNGKWRDVISQYSSKDTEEVEFAYWAQLELAKEATNALRNGFSDDGLQQTNIAFQKALEIKPNGHEAHNNWGAALAAIGGLTKDYKYYEQSIEHYRSALSIKPDKHEAFYNWGNALIDLDRLTDDPSRSKQAIEQYRRAVEIKPDDHAALNNWGSALLRIWHTAPADNLLAEAVSVLSRCEGLTGKANYNLACALSLQGQLDQTQAKLLQCEADSTLPTSRHLLQDPDLASLRELGWFAHLIERRQAIELTGVKHATPDA